ncbi:hypothetical protein V501_10001 [Pseudogymnoascus sp. VKM F-4519 (FW-2642)]|nr:hypothetical protein V501_10001 [Pseudogymnoascus sp. VKM F-4519 (FW-2642)]
MLEKPLKSWPTLVALSSPDGALQQCNLAMMALYANLTLVEGPMKIIESARWPVKRKKVEQCLKDIVAHKNIFIESLNVEHISEIIKQTRQLCLDRPTDRVLAYFYFSFRDTEKQMTSNLLRSLLLQLLESSDSISSSVRNLYDGYSHTQPPTDQLLSSIRSVIDSHRNKNVFIIIDASDECPSEGGERSDLCDSLRAMKEWAARNLHVLVTSRSLIELTNSLDALCTIDSISIEGAVVESDIRKFIRTQLSNDRKLQKRPTEIQGEIENAPSCGAQGMFLWVACQVNSLRKCVTASDVDKVLKSLPKTLDSAYERILMSIDTEHIQIAHIALRWISHAHKPVTIEELAEAVIIDLTASCMFYISNKSAAEDIVQKCLSYITDYSVSNRKKESQQDLEEFPLLQYVSHFWHKQLLANEDMITNIGADVYAVGEGSCNAAASATLNSDVRGVCGFALESAVWSVNTEILQLLLEAEANVNAQDGDYGAALHAASMLGHLEFVALLIKAGANVNADTEKYGTPLEAAFQCGLGDAEDHIDVIELLLAAGADPGILSSEEIELIQDTRTLKKLLAAGIDRTMIIDEVFEKFREPIKGWPSGL